MAWLKSIASYAIIGVAVTSAYFPTAATAQEADYDRCVQGCIQTWGASSPYANNLRLAQCVNICEQRYLGGQGPNPPYVPPYKPPEIDYE